MKTWKTPDLAGAAEGAGGEGLVESEGAERVRAERPDGERRAPILAADGARDSSEREGEERGSEVRRENWAEALEWAESPDALERPSTAFEAASWAEANAAAVARTGFGAAADLAAGELTPTPLTAFTATDGVARWETGIVLGTTAGAARDGDRNKDGDDRDDNELGVVPKTGIPVSEALELAPAALEIPDEGTEIWIDRTCARAGEAPSARDKISAMD